jgi:hypothetical protein
MYTLIHTGYIGLDLISYPRLGMRMGIGIALPCVGDGNR